MGSIAANSYATVTIDATAYWPFLFYGAGSSHVASVLVSALVTDDGIISGVLKNVTGSADSPTFQACIKRL